jgi:hypothetical protein
MGKSARVYFLTAYIEYLLDQGIHTEETYLGDASRFLRYLLSTVTDKEIDQYIKRQTTSVSYAKRLRCSLRKFFNFANERLQIADHPLGSDEHSAIS